MSWLPSGHFPIVIPPVYEVYRGYIVFVFSVTMFVCLWLCLYVNFFFVKGFSGTTAPRILKVRTHTGYDLLYCVKEKQPPPAYHSLYLSIFPSQNSQLLWEPKSSNFVYTLRWAKYIVEKKTKMLWLIMFPPVRVGRHIVFAWFVCPSFCPSVRLSVTKSCLLCNLKTVQDIFMKLHIILTNIRRHADTRTITLVFILFELCPFELCK